MPTPGRRRQPVSGVRRRPGERSRRDRQSDRTAAGVPGRRLFVVGRAVAAAHAGRRQSLVLEQRRARDDCSVTPWSITTPTIFATECAAYDAAVTDWERRRYFERI